MPCSNAVNSRVELVWLVTIEMDQLYNAFICGNRFTHAIIKPNFNIIHAEIGFRHEFSQEYRID